MQNTLMGGVLLMHVEYRVGLPDHDWLLVVVRWLQFCPLPPHTLKI